MNNSFALRAAPAAAMLLVLAACGGGSGDPEPTPATATIAVTAATNATFNGVFTSNAVALSEVEKRNPVGSEPEVCSFRFSGLQRAGGGTMDGDIRYLPGTNTVHVVFVSINGIEFNTRERTNATVDRANSRVDFTGKVLTASTGVASTVTIDGAVPLRGNRPEGC
jgi:hypothetical protein